MLILLGTSFHFLSLHVEFCWNIAIFELWTIITHYWLPGQFGFAFLRNTGQFRPLEQDANPYVHTIISKYFLEIMGRLITHFGRNLSQQNDRESLYLLTVPTASDSCNKLTVEGFFLYLYSPMAVLLPRAAHIRYPPTPSFPDKQRPHTQTNARNLHTYEPCTSFSSNSWALFAITILPAGCKWDFSFVAKACFSAFCTNLFWTKVESLWCKGFLFFFACS